MSDDEATNEPTILDYLNDDCLRLILQHVPVKDVILSERVSRRWQKLVLDYLRHVRIGLQVMDYGLQVSKSLIDKHWLPLHEADFSSFKKWIDKLGTSVVAAQCDTEQKFHIFGKKCPNIEAVMFYELPETLLEQQYENFMRLHWISLNRCFHASEICVSRYIAGDMLKEVEIGCITYLTGHCLTNITSKNLTSLTIYQCEHLEIRHLVSAADRLGELRKFTLFEVSAETYNNIHLLLAKMPKLEHLHVYIYSLNLRDQIRKDNLFQSVCRLTNLRHFGTDLGASDEDLKVVARSCPELRSLLLEDCQQVTGRGMAAVCRYAGARLTKFGVSSSEHITDDDVEACVRACPNLETLDVRFTSKLSAGLLKRVRAARRPHARSLLLYAHSTGIMDKYYHEGERDGVKLSYDFVGPVFYDYII